ncbi:MAG: hypothetical protein B6244_12820 [Candidatus Cloacimonetes bacterium 4572_55]|nr:MAG: hypothetical protein B6244_12820 [Candidatus Cloacimonetes bacterium 4572_55]
MRVKKVLMSVANHKGLVDFARRLCHIDIDIIAVEETMRMLMDNKICVGSFDDFVSRPALSYPHSRMLHPNVLDSIFSSDTDRSDFDPVQLIVINLDPYRRSPSFTAPIENMSRINIDESAIIRAAAKNYHRIAVVVDPSDYLGIWWELNHNGFCLSLETRQRLALKAFQHTVRIPTRKPRFIENWIPIQTI